MPKPLVQFNNVTKRFGTRTILDGIDLTIYEGEITTIIGKSGVGKSVFLKHIIGLLTPDEGEILFMGQRFADMNRKEQQDLKNVCSYMFQHNALFDSLTVFENIALPLRERTRLPASEIKTRVMEKIEQLELGEVPHKYPTQLSGGMQKRVALARALINNPKIVLFDEPTTGLDPIRKNAVLTMVAHYQQQFNFSAVLVSHDIPDVFYISDRIAIIDEAKILFQGTPTELEQTDHPVINEFIHSLNLLKEDLAGLTSRHVLQQAFSTAQTSQDQSDGPFSVISLTVQGLADITNHIGAIASHHVLENFSRAWQKAISPQTLVARYDDHTAVALVPATELRQVEDMLTALSKMPQNTQHLHIQGYGGDSISATLVAGVTPLHATGSLKEHIRDARNRQTSLTTIICSGQQAESIS